MHKYQTCFSSS